MVTRTVERPSNFLPRIQQLSARMRSEGWSVCLSDSRTSRNYAVLQRHMGSKNKNAFCFVRKLELTIRSAILSHVHAPYTAGIPYKSPYLSHV